MASHEGSRKRLKISRTEGKSTPSCSTPTIPSASTYSLAKNNMATSANTSAAPCAHSQDLKTLHTDLEAMRQLVTCKICDRLLYEPYSLACGHTYCYSCLSQWLVSGHKKTCPDCRSPVRQQPTPCYIIRELVLVFVSRNELLPDGETSEEHNKLVKEEADIVAKDKGNKDARNGGLFKGCFSRGGRQVLPPMHDPSDGVYRCPDCNWELEDGVCGSCGWEDDYGAGSPWPSDFDDGSEADIDHELEDEIARLEESDAVYGADGADDYFGDDDFDDSNTDVDRYVDRERAGPPVYYPVARAMAEPRPYVPVRNRHFVDLRSSEDESSEDEEDGDEMHDFIVDDDRRIDLVTDDDDEEEEEDTDVPIRPRYRDHGQRRGVSVAVISDIDDQSSTIGPQESESEDSDDEPVASGSQRRKRMREPARSRRAVTISSEDSDGDGESASSPDEGDDEVEIREVAGGFSPLDDDESESDSEPDDY